MIMYDVSCIFDVYGEHMYTYYVYVYTCYMIVVNMEICYQHFSTKSTIIRKSASNATFHHDLSWFLTF